MSLIKPLYPFSSVLAFNEKAHLIHGKEYEL